MPFSGDEDVIEQSRSDARDRMIQTLVGSEDDHVYITPEDDVDSFHGRFAGLTVLRTVRDLADTMARVPGHRYGKALAEAFDTTRVDLGCGDPLATFALLPSREMLQQSIAAALDGTLSCQECLDREELQTKIERLYTCDPEEYTLNDRRALGLIYALMALGRQRQGGDSSNSSSSIDAGYVVLRG